MIHSIVSGLVSGTLRVLHWWGDHRLPWSLPIQTTPFQRESSDAIFLNLREIWPRTLARKSWLYFSPGLNPAGTQANLMILRSSSSGSASDGDAAEEESTAAAIVGVA